MRVNLILSASPGLSQDAALFAGILSHVLGGDKVQFRRVPHVHPQCEEAEVNVFFEVLNPVLFSQARYNLWIPNAEWAQTNWKPYAAQLDAIWVKTHHAEALFKDWNPNVRQIGWTSIDKVRPERKNYHKALVPIGRNLWRHPRPILQAYLRIQEENPELYNRLPQLHLVYNAKLTGEYAVPQSIAGKLRIHNDVLPEAQQNELLHECGLVILMSAAEGFCHAANEAMSAGCNLIVPDLPVFHELTEHAQWVEVAKTQPHPDCLDTLAEVSVDSLIVQLRRQVHKSFQARKDDSDFVRQEYEVRHTEWIQRFEQMEPLSGVAEYSLQAQLPPEEELPNVSVVTITRDRRLFFGLAKFSFLSQAQPAEKIEWVIIDDGSDQIKDLVTDLPYVKQQVCERKMTIGEKRNIGVKLASHDVIVHMDDDDVYPNHSLLTRVAMLKMKPERGCVFSTTIPCYDVVGRKSFMNVPPLTLPMSERVSEATMAYTRAFWEERPFSEVSVAEADAFLRGREGACREVSPQDVIVSLVHPRQSTSRKAPEMEPNGCHYGFSEELFTLIEEIRLALTA